MYTHSPRTALAALYCIVFFCSPIISQQAKANCCDNISIKTIGLSYNNTTCCFQLEIKGFENCNPKPDHLWIEKWDNGVWFPVTPPTPLSANQTSFYSTQFCGPVGRYTYRVTFANYNTGTLLCEKYISVNCGFHCDQITIQYVQPISSPDPNTCCFFLVVNAPGLHDAFQYEVEEIIGSQTLSLGSYPYRESSTGLFATKNFCVSKGKHQLRFIFRDYAGNIICVKEFPYNCEADCCTSMELNIVPAPDEGWGDCCFYLQGYTLCSNATSYTLDEFKTGGWVNLPDYGNLFDPNTAFSILICTSWGEHNYRMTFYDDAGNILCSRTLTYRCGAECCDQVQVTAGQTEEAGLCCIRFTIPLGSVSCPFYGWGIQQLHTGLNEWRWTNGLMYDSPMTSFDVIECTEWWNQDNNGVSHFRIVFMDADGNPVCVKDISISCYYTDFPKQSGGEAGVQPVSVVQSLSAQPNPSTDETTLSFALNTSATVTIELYNIIGEGIVLQAEKQFSRGAHTIPFSTRNLPNGIYRVLMLVNGIPQSLSLSVVR